jgi:murein DD-endopeptidase MepM/ murein hydrolase activator NlpD
MTFRSVHLGAWVCLAATVGCSGNNFLTRLTVAPSPHEQYADALRAAPLAGTAMAQDWLRAADRALAQPLAVTLPWRESAYFPAGQPIATAYRFELQRGRRLEVQVTFDSVETAQLFVDLFEEDGAAPPERVASLAEGGTLTYDVRRDGSYLLRVQPELLRSGRYDIIQRTVASLIFPVSGLTARAVQSEFGAARDAGRREHEGIDIFAPRNTPVVAVVEGTAAPGTNDLGGNVVWLRDRRTSRAFYYAHLTRWAFEDTTAVQAGDVVGYVGNTGNARRTAPHLHFGIYERGAIDPLPFLRADDAVPAPNSSGAGALGELVRTTRARTPLAPGIRRSSPAGTRLERGSVARVLGLSGTRLRVMLPDQSTGYLDESAVTVARAALGQQRLDAGAVVRDQPLVHAPILHMVEQPVTVAVLGQFRGFDLIRLESGSLGWVEQTRR